MPKKIKSRKNPRIIAKKPDAFYKKFINDFPPYMLQRMRKSLKDAYLDGAEDINWSIGSDLEVLKAVDTIYIGGLEEFIKLNSDPLKPLKQLRLASYRWYP